MTYTGYIGWTTGETLYAKSRPLDATWGSGVVSLTENGSTGEFSASLDEATEYAVYLQSGGSPAPSDTWIADFPKNVSAESAFVTLRQNAQLARQWATNKRTVTNNGDGTYDITLRNDDDTSDVVTIRGYNPQSGNVSTPQGLDVEEETP